MSKIKEMYYILRLYRLHSKYYVKLAYFWFFSFIILCYSRYIVINHIVPAKIVGLILALLVLIIIPLCNIYYIIRCVISIGKKLYYETYTNKNLWISDLIYILTLLYVLIINYFPNLKLLWNYNTYKCLISSK